MTETEIRQQLTDLYNEGKLWDFKKQKLFAYYWFLPIGAQNAIKDFNVRVEFHEDYGKPIDVISTFRVE